MSARPEFLFIVDGWRFGDTVEIMGEYIEEAAAFRKAHKATPAESEIVKAMISRQICLAIDRGDFDFAYDDMARRHLPTLADWRRELKEAIA